MCLCPSAGDQRSPLSLTPVGMESLEVECAYTPLGMGSPSGLPGTLCCSSTLPMVATEASS
jgi:hypothetical protein